MNNQNILVIGASGFLGRSVFYKLKSYNTFGTSYSCDYKGLVNLDIVSKNNVKKLFDRFRPSTIIHTAAFVNVNDAEIRKNEAWNINVKGTQNIARYSEIYKSHLIYISTDYVFNGASGIVYENTTPSPINYYGKTKYEAECIVKNLSTDNLIIRPSILYDVTKKYYKNNFFSYVYQELSKNQKIYVDNYRIKYPLFIDDVSSIIKLAIKNKVNGLINVCGPQSMTRYQWAVIIAKSLNLNHNLIIKAKTKEMDKPFDINMKNNNKLIDYKTLTIEDSIKKKMK